MQELLGDTGVVESVHDVEVLVIVAHTDDPKTLLEGVESRLEQILDDHLSRRWLVEARSQRFGESLSFRYRVVVRDPDDVGPMMRAISNLEGVERVVLDLGDENSLGD